LNQVFHTVDYLPENKDDLRGIQVRGLNYYYGIHSGKMDTSL
jgi:hypothetical protein